jgi:hypothetical protein
MAKVEYHAVTAGELAGELASILKAELVLRQEIVRLQMDLAEMRAFLLRLR